MLTHSHDALMARVDAVLAPVAARGASPKARLLRALASLFDRLASKKAVLEAYPRLAESLGALYDHLNRQDPELLEDDLATIYCYLHGSDRGYSEQERREMDAAGGYWCHAGGLSPLLLAAPHIHPGTRLVDYGAGNGLQGLLFQYLYPHEVTVQIELSGTMIEAGKRLQRFMDIPAGRVKWIHGSVMDIPPADFDFIYLYRPLRPERQQGRAFYERFAQVLHEVGHPVTILSVADCLKDYLSPRFTIFYDDGHLACFSNGGTDETGPGR